MPTYTYRCANCGDVLIWQSIAEESLTEHGCGGKLTKVYTPPMLSAEATPTKRNQTVQTKRADSQLSKDRDAYKRLRMDGLQPKRVGGSADLEGKIDHPDEIKYGRKITHEERTRMREAQDQIREWAAANERA